MMDTSDEWKSLWAISSVHSSPLLLSPTTKTTGDKEIGPVIFNSPPKPPTHRHLFSSPDFSPQIPPPYPNISLSRFLHTSSAILPSTATSIASQLSSSLPNPEGLLTHNSLQLLRCPGTNSCLAFFPTGSNSDQVGFVVLSVNKSQLKVRGAYGETEVFTSHNALGHRIIKISLNPLADCEYNSGDFCESTIGYLLAYSACSVNYYSIRITLEGSGNVTPRLELAGNKLFKSSAIVHACWSPHLPEESLVLLESGDLFLFDLNSLPRSSISSYQLTGEKVKVLWGESVVSEKGGWFSCDFSWHLRILIVVHSSGVFLVDSRSEKSNVIPLLKLDAEHGSKDRFVAFSIAAPDRFYFTLASNHTVFLCDIRKPMIPLLRWAHNVANPSYVSVSSLSDLRSQSEDATYRWASEAGYGILLGSFWNGDFSLFCYGPDVRKSVSSSYHAWGLPSDLALITNECHCGDCLVKEEFSKDRLPNWVNWQQKKEIVLGFVILDKGISSQLFESDIFGGFTLVTLTSAGNIELHRYCAAWDYSQTSEKGHIAQPLGLNDSVLYQTGEEEYKFRKVFHYFKLEWLDGYLKSDLARILSKELVKFHDSGRPEKTCIGQDFHESICQKLNTFSSGGVQGCIKTYDVLKDISLPTSIHEISLRSMWGNLPKNVLRFGFSTYTDLPDIPRKKVNYLPFEFLEVTCHQPHLPPFFFRFSSSRSSKWSDKQTPSSSLVGPVIPLPFLMTLHKTNMLKADEQSADSEIDCKCNEVMRVASGIIETESQSCNERMVSLADDNEDMFQSSEQSFASYKLTSMADSVFKDEKHTNIMFKADQKNKKDLFDSDCQLKFKFDEKDKSFGSNEMTSYELLKTQYSVFKKGLPSYQNYITKSNIPK